MTMKTFLIIYLYVISVAISSLALAVDEKLVDSEVLFSHQDRLKAGQFVCGKSGFDITDKGVHCHVCPEFSGQSGGSEGMDIDFLIRGNFTGVESKDVLLNTLGCEAHYDNFGGMILLSEISNDKKSTLLVVSPDNKKDDGNLKFQYYFPGYRLDDCLVFDEKHSRSLLVCNEYWSGQGDVIGHVSAIEVSSRAVTRWRLFRWYDNTASDAKQPISFAPEKMYKSFSPESDNETLVVELNKIKAPEEYINLRKKYKSNKIKLNFIRDGQRFFSDEETQDVLGSFNYLTREILD